LASVSVDDVRDVVNVSSAEVPDAKVLKMIKRAEVTLELETDKEIDYSSCTEQEKEAITVLAAIYALVYLSGGVASGLNYSIGDLSVSQVAGSGYSASIAVLDKQLKELLENMKGTYLGRV